MDPSVSGTQKKRTERAFESQSKLLEELEVSMLLQSHEDAKAEESRTKTEKEGSSKLKAKHCKHLTDTTIAGCRSTVSFSQLTVWQEPLFFRLPTCKSHKLQLPAGVSDSNKIRRRITRTSSATLRFCFLFTVLGLLVVIPALYSLYRQVC